MAGHFSVPDKRLVIIYKENNIPIIREVKTITTQSKQSNKVIETIETTRNSKRARIEEETMAGKFIIGF
jgi:hypothetical protein